MTAPYSLDDPDQATFEDRKVGFVLRAFGLRYQPDGRASCDFYALLDDQEQTDTRRLTFDAFHRRFPTFPVRLYARHIGGMGDRHTAADLFRRFDKLVLLDVFLEVYSRHQSKGTPGPVGLVIPFGGIRGGAVVHNAAIDTGSTRVVHRLRADVPPYRVTVEPFARFLTYLARGDWSPDGDPWSPDGDPPPVSDQAPEAAGVMDLRPWMVARLGTGPAAVVLAWLVGVLGSADGRVRRLVRRVDGGDRCVAATRGQVVAGTGLSLAAVHRAIDRLKDEGLVSTWVRKRRTYFRVEASTRP